jgi:hypothetical protein
MHPAATVARVLELSEQGHSNCEISRRTGVSRPTIRDWVRGKLPHSFQAKPMLYGKPGAIEICATCGGNAHRFDELSTAYVYLLGLYLGDGTISRAPRDVFKLRVFLDLRYPGIVAECEAAIKAVMPYNAVGRLLRESNCYEVYAHSKAWPCLFPQQGPGMKHTRHIWLTDWQQEFADLVPHELLRGLVHSDGCRFINTGRGGWRCPRHTFSNTSEDIKGIFCRACDQLGLHWTRAGEKTIYVSRKADVARMDEFIGPKY